MKKLDKIIAWLFVAVVCSDLAQNATDFWTDENSNPLLIFWLYIIHLPLALLAVDFSACTIWGTKKS